MRGPLQLLVHLHSLFKQRNRLVNTAGHQRRSTQVVQERRHFRMLGSVDLAIDRQCFLPLGCGLCVAARLIEKRSEIVHRFRGARVP